MVIPLHVRGCGDQASTRLHLGSIQYSGLVARLLPPGVCIGKHGDSGAYIRSKLSLLRRHSLTAAEYDRQHLHAKLLSPVRRLERTGDLPRHMQGQQYWLSDQPPPPHSLRSLIRLRRPIYRALSQLHRRPAYGRRSMDPHEHHLHSVRRPVQLKLGPPKHIGPSRENTEGNADLHAFQRAEARLETGSPRANNDAPEEPGVSTPRRSQSHN